MLDGASPNRGRRRAQVNLQNLNAAELIVLEKKAAVISSKKTWVFSFFAFIFWTCWMIIGTCFYKFYSELSWAKAFFMNVNVGWGLNWVLDDSFESDYFLKHGGLQLFSTLHTVAGFIFILYFCIYVAIQLIVKKNQWLNNATEQKSQTCIAHLCRKYLPISVQEFDFSIWKFIIFFNVWIVVGIVWYSSTHNWHVLGSIDYVFSTATGAGYKTIEDSSADYEYAIVALYCVIACPLTTVSIGLIASTFFEPPHYRLMNRMFADICQEELDFMVDFGLIDTDGQMSQEEFIILMAVRINRASPELINGIYTRFQELDRKQTGTIDLNDLLESKYQSRRHLFGVNKYNQVIMESRVLSEVETTGVTGVNIDRHKIRVNTATSDQIKTVLEESSMMESPIIVGADIKSNDSLTLDSRDTLRSTLGGITVVDDTSDTMRVDSITIESSDKSNTMLEDPLTIKYSPDITDTTTDTIRINFSAIDSPDISIAILEEDPKGIPNEMHQIDESPEIRDIVLEDSKIESYHLKDAMLEDSHAVESPDVKDKVLGILSPVGLPDATGSLDATLGCSTKMKPSNIKDTICEDSHTIESHNITDSILEESLVEETILSNLDDVINNDKDISNPEESLNNEKTPAKHVPSCIANAEGENSIPKFSSDVPAITIGRIAEMSNGKDLIETYHDHTSKEDDNHASLTKPTNNSQDQSPVEDSTNKPLKMTTHLTIDTDITIADDADDIEPDTEMDSNTNFEKNNPDDLDVSVTSSVSSSAIPTQNISSVCPHPSGNHSPFKKMHRRPSLKKNVFSIMETMQTEYIVHGNHVDNLYSPRKAADALVETSSSRPRPTRRGGISLRDSQRSLLGINDLLVSPLRGLRRRRSTVSQSQEHDKEQQKMIEDEEDQVQVQDKRSDVETSNSGSVFNFSLRNILSGVNGSPTTTENETQQEHGQQRPTPFALRRYKSMELPARWDKSFVAGTGHTPPADAMLGHQMDEDMHRRRESLEISSRNLQFDKYKDYKGEPDPPVLRHKPPLRRRSMGGVEMGIKENCLDQLPPLPSPAALSKEKTLRHLSEMNKNFKRRKSSFLLPPPSPLPLPRPATLSVMKLFRTVSFDGSQSSFSHAEDNVEEDNLSEIATIAATTTTLTLFGIQLINTKTYASIRYILSLPLVRIFSLWVFWIVIGALFFTLYQQSDEQISFACGLYMSVSVGIGMFWMHGSTCNLVENPGTKAFSIVWICFGAIALGVLRAFVAHTMAESKSLWYLDVNASQDKPDTFWGRLTYFWSASKENMRDCVRLGSRMQVHCTLMILIVFGLTFSCARFGFSFLRGLLFSLSALSCGGFVPVPDGQSAWDYAVVTVFITVGVPIMAVSLSLVANSIVQQGSGFAARSEFDHVMRILVTDKELAMLSALNLHIDRVMDKREFTVLILLRVGAMTPAFVTVIVDWYQGIFEHTDLTDEKDKTDDFLGKELIEFSSSSESSDSDSNARNSICSENSDNSEMGDKQTGKQNQNQRRSRRFTANDKGRATLSFSDMMSFSQVDENNSLRDRANNCLSSMVVE